MSTLEYAARPLSLLHGEGAQIGRHETEACRPEVDGAPSGCVQTQRCVEILGETGLIAVDALQRGAPESGVTPPHGRRVAAVHAHRCRPVDVVRLFDGGACDERIIAIVEPHSALHERDARFVERAEHRVEEVRRRDMVDVEDRHELTARAGERGVDVARLRVLVPRAPGSRRRGVQRARRIVDCVRRRADRCDADSASRSRRAGSPPPARTLVVHRHEDVDRAAGRRSGRAGTSMAS